MKTKSLITLLLLNLVSANTKLNIGTEVELKKQAGLFVLEGEEEAPVENLEEDTENQEV